MDNKKISVYLAGPIHSKSSYSRIALTDSLKTFIEHYFGPDSALINNPEDYTPVNGNVVEIDKFFIKASNVIIANVDKVSVGTSMEIMYAFTLGIPVILICPDKFLSPWHFSHTTVRFLTLGSFVKVLTNEDNSSNPGDAQGRLILNIFNSIMSNKPL